jgi:RNA 2',3'-cyclic 3'-phosphodiesterase
MHRLFIALRPPRPMREALLAAMGGVEGARWQDDDQLHLTLRFIGEVDRHVAADIVATLGSVSHPGFGLRLDGIGSFDRRGRIETIWAGVAPHDQVRSLHVAVSRALTRAGIAPEERAFVPHITLARFSRGPGSTAALPMEQLWPPPIEGHFDQFILYESELGSSGAVYSAIERYSLS